MSNPSFITRADLAEMINDLREEMRERFDKIDAKLKQHDERFDETLDNQAKMLEQLQFEQP